MPSLNLMHGSDYLFEQFDQSKARLKNDLWGGGVAYLTDNKDVAKQYAEAMARKSKKKNKLLYYVTLNASKIFDEDESQTGQFLAKAAKTIGSEKFARGAGLLPFGADKYAVMAGLEKGTSIITGKQFFMGLSGGMVDTAKAREFLARNGYDALRYNGGEMGITSNKVRHSVYIGYSANDIRINKTELF